MPIPRGKLRLSDQELDVLLTTERTAYVATTAPDGSPHVVPLWFVWHDGALWVNSLIRSRRTRDIERGSRAAVCVDGGVEYGELRGVVLYGSFQEPDEADSAGVDRVRAIFGSKYWGGAAVPAVKSHRLLRLIPERVASWDFRKIASSGA